MLNKTVKIEVPDALKQFKTDAVFINKQINDVKKEHYFCKAEVSQQVLLLKQTSKTVSSNGFDDYALVNIIGYYPKENRVVIQFLHQDKFVQKVVNKNMLSTINNLLINQPINNIKAIKKNHIDNSLFIRQIPIYNPDEYGKNPTYIPDKQVQTSSLMENSSILRIKDIISDMYPNKFMDTKKQLLDEVFQLFQKDVTFIFKKFNGPDVIFLDEAQKIIYDNSFQATKYYVKYSSVNSNKDQLFIDLHLRTQSCYLQKLGTESNFETFAILDGKQSSLYDQHQMARNQLMQKQKFQTYFLQAEILTITYKRIYELTCDSVYNKEQVDISKAILIVEQFILMIENEQYRIFLYEQFNSLKVDQKEIQLMNPDMQNEIDNYFRGIENEIHPDLPHLKSIKQLLFLQEKLTPLYRITFGLYFQQFISFQAGIRIFDSIFLEFFNIYHSQLFNYTFSNFLEFEKEIPKINEFKVLLPDLKDKIADSKEFNKLINEQFAKEIDLISDPDIILKVVQRKLLLLNIFLSELGFQSLRKQFDIFPFNFQLELKYNIQKSKIEFWPPLDQASIIYSTFIKGIVKNIYYQPMEFSCELIGKIGELTFKSFSSHSEQDYYFDFLFKKLEVFQLFEDEKPQIDDYLDQIESLIILLTDVLQQNFSLLEEKKQWQDYIKSEDNQSYLQLINQINDQNNIVKQHFQNQQLELLDLDSFYVLKVIKDVHGTLPLQFTDMLENIVQYKITTNKIFCSLINDIKYFYCIQLDLSSLKNYFIRNYQQLIKEINSTIIDNFYQFTLNLTDNFILFHKAVKFTTQNIQFFYKSIQLRQILNSNCTILFHRKFSDWIDRSIFQIITLFADDGSNSYVVYSQQPIVQESYDKLKIIQVLEKIVATNDMSLVQQLPEKFSDVKYYKNNEVCNLLFKVYNSFILSLDNIKLSIFDQLQYCVQIYFQLIIELKFFIAQVDCRIIHYQQFQQSLENYLVMQLGHIENYVQQTLFTSNQIILKNEELSSDKIYTMDISTLQINQKDSNITSQLFEKEYLHELQKHTFLTIQNEGNVIIPSKIEILDILLLKFYKKSFQQNNFSNLKGIVSYFISLRNVIFNTQEILVLYQIKLRIDSWLQFQVKDINQTKSSVVENYRYFIQYLTPIHSIFCYELLIYSYHNMFLQSKLLYYPVQEIVNCYQLLLNYLIQFKQKFQNFVQFIQTSQITFNLDFLTVLDRNGELVKMIYPLVSTFIILKQKDILPIQYSAISSTYQVFIDSSLFVDIQDIMKIFNNNTIKFYNQCILLQHSITKNMHVFNQLMNCYSYISKMQISIIQQNHLQFSQFEYYSFDFQPKNLQNTIDFAQVLISFILLQDQFSFHKQIIILARDFESILLNSNQLYILLERFQFLINDVLMVKEYGNIIELDLLEIEKRLILPKCLQKKGQKGIKQKNLVANESQNILTTSLKNVVSKLTDIINKTDNGRIQKINILSDIEQKQIIDAHKLIKMFYQKQTDNIFTFISIIQLSKSNKGDLKNFIKELGKHMNNLEVIQRRLYFSRFSVLFDRYQKLQYQRLSNNGLTEVVSQYSIFDTSQSSKTINKSSFIQNRKQRFESYKSEQKQLTNQEFTNTAFIIPQTNGVYYLGFLIFDFIILEAFASFSNWYQLFLTSDRLKAIFFDNIDEMDVQKSILRGHVLLSLTSSQEKFVFDQPMVCPDVMYKLPDLIYSASCSSFITQFNQSQQFFLAQNYNCFLQTLYQFQFFVLISSDLTSLNHFKLFIQNLKVHDYIPIMCRLEEIIIFYSVNNSYQLKITNNHLFIGDNLPIYAYWQGAPRSVEKSILQQHILQYAFSIIDGFNQKSVVLTCQEISDINSNKKTLQQVQCYLSRLTSRAISNIYMSSMSFDDHILHLQSLLLNGRIVFIHNILTLSFKEQSQLVDFLINFNQHQGEVQNTYNLQVSKYKIQEIIDKRNTLLQQGKELNQEDQGIYLSQDDFILQNAQYDQFQDTFGYFVLSMEFSQSNIKIDLDQKLFNQFQQKNTYSFAGNEDLTTFFKQFNDPQIINFAEYNIQNNTLLQEFNLVSPVFGNQFMQLYQILKQFNYKFSLLSPQDVQLILKLVQDSTNAFQISTMVVEFLIRQYIDVTEKQHDIIKSIQCPGFPNHSENNIKTISKNVHSIKKQQAQRISKGEHFVMIANLTSSIFGLQKTHQSILVNMVKYYNGLKLKTSKQTKGQNVTFQRYFVQFISVILSPQSNQIIQSIIKQFQSGYSMAYEVFLLLHFQQLKRPILLFSDYKYSQILLSQLCSAAVNQPKITKQILCISNYNHFTKVFTSLTVNDYIYINPTSVNEINKISQFLLNMDTKKMPNIFISLFFSKIQQTQLSQVVQSYEKRFISIQESYDLIGSQLYQFGNIIYNYVHVQQQIFETNLVFQSKFIYNLLTTRKLLSDDLKKTQSRFFRLKLLNSVYKSFYILYFDFFTEQFRLGNHQDHIMVIRSLVQFYLFKFNIIQPINQTTNMSAQNQEDIEQQNKERLLNDIFQQNQQNLQNECSVEYNAAMNSLNRLYSLDFQHSQSQQYGFNLNDLENIKKELEKIQSSTNSNSIALKIIQQQIGNYGIGCQGSIQFEFTQKFIIKYLQQESMVDSIIFFIIPLQSAIWNAFSLLNQFIQPIVLNYKRYESFIDFVKNFDLEKVKITGIMQQLFKNPLNYCLYENSLGTNLIPTLDPKSKYNNIQLVLKFIVQQGSQRIPQQYSIRQFSYLLYDNNQLCSQFVPFTLGKGVLQNIALSDFILTQQKQRSKPTQKVNQNDYYDADNVDANQVDEFDDFDMWQDEQEEPSDDADVSLDLRLQKMMNASKDIMNLVHERQDSDSDDASIAKSARTAVSKFNTSVQFTKFSVSSIKEFGINFKSQFDPRTFQGKRIDFQQIDSYNFILFDDERIALAVLIGASMMTPITFAVSGQQNTGKSMIIMASKLIMRDLVCTNLAQVNDYSKVGSVNLVQQNICRYYQRVQYPFFNTLKQNENQFFDLDINNIDIVEEQIEEYYKFMQYEYEQQATKDLFECKFKFIDLKDKLNQMFSVSQQLDQNVIDQNIIQLNQQETKQTITEKYILPRTVQKQQIYYYIGQLGFPCFHFHSSQLQTDQVHDNFVSMLRDHVLVLDNIQGDILDQIYLDNVVDKQIGQIQLSDTSFLLELDDTNQNLQQYCNIQYNVPKISISFMRKYFKYLLIQRKMKMSDEWIQSFFNGLNLIQGDLPPNLFNNFKFIQQIIRENVNLLPSYSKLVKQSVKMSKIDMKLSIEDYKRDLKPDLWVQLINGYEFYGANYEKIIKDVNFDQYLNKVIQTIIDQPNTKISMLQTILALNQDEVFKQLNIYSLIHILKKMNVNNQRIISMLERFTSLNLLGYLNLNQNIIDKNSLKLTQIRKIKLFHPWQNTQNHLQIYPSFISTMVQQCLLQQKDNQIATFASVQKAFSNKFANKLFYTSSPLLVDQDWFQNKLPFRKIFSKYVKPLPTTIQLTYQIQHFMQQQQLSYIYQSGLIAAGLSQDNPFYIAHFIQLYKECADYLDPCLLISAFQIVIQMLQMKQRNAAIFSTQIQTNIFEDYQGEFLTGYNSFDFLRNYKLFLIYQLQEYLTYNFIQEEETKNKVQSILIEQKIQDYVSDSSSVCSSNQQSEQQEQSGLIYKGIMQTMLYSLKIPLFELQLNSNANVNQYNLLVQVISQISQFQMMSADNMKQVFKQMQKTDNIDEDGDVSDNQSVASKASSAYTATSNSSGIMQNYQTDQPQKLKQENADTKVIQNLTYKQFRFFNTIKQQQKIIIDVQNIMQTLVTTQNNQKKQSKSTNKTDKKVTDDILSYLRTFMMEVQLYHKISVDALEYLIILQIIRFSILMALGIKPIYAFCPSTYYRIGFKQDSTLQSKTIGISISSILQNQNLVSKNKSGLAYSEFNFGTTSSQISQRISSYVQNYQPEQEDFINKNLYSKINEVSYPDIHETVNKYTEDPLDILLIIQKSVLNRESSTGISVYTTLLQALQSDTFVQQIFDQDEIYNIIKILSQNLEFNVEMDIKDLIGLLSVTFSVLIIDDKPIVNDIQQEFGKDQLNLDNIQNMGRISNVIENFINSQDIDQLRDKQVDQHVTTDQGLEINKFNTLFYQNTDIIKLFRISNCSLPQNFNVLDKFGISFKTIQLEFANISVQIYKQIMSISGQWNVSFNEFTHLASSIVNQQLKSIQQFFDNISFLFTSYKFFDALASPTKQKGKLTDYQNISADLLLQTILQYCKDISEGKSPGLPYDPKIFNQVNQKFFGQICEISTLQTEKYQFQQFPLQVFTSVQESSCVRDLLYTLIEFLRNQYKTYYNALLSAHIDGIFMCCYIYFSQTNQLPGKKIYDYLKTGRFCRLFGNTLNVVNKTNVETIQNIQVKYDIFLVFLTALVQESGVPVDISFKGIKQVQPGSNEEINNQTSKFTNQNPLLLCGHSCSPNQIQNNFALVNSFNYPILAVLEANNLIYKINDPDKVNLFNLAVINQILQKNTYLIGQELLLSSICLLELLRRADNNQIDLQKFNTHFLNNPTSQSNRKFVDDITRKLILIDMNLEPNKFNILLSRVLSISDYFVVFANFGVKSHQDNCSTLRKFLVLRSRKTIQKRQTIYIGKQSCVVNQPLHKYKVIIAYDQPFDINFMLQKSGLLTQDFIDSICILGKVFNNSDKEEDNQMDVMAQQIIKSVFQEKSTQRFYSEEYRINLSLCQIQLKEIYQVISKYFYYNIFDENLQNYKTEKFDKFLPTDDNQQQNTEQRHIYQMDEFQFSQLTDMLINTPQNIIKTNITSSYILNGSLQQKEDFNKLLESLKNLINSQYQNSQFQFVQVKPKVQQVRKQYMSVKQLSNMKYQDTPIQAKCSAVHITQTIGIGYAKQLSIALCYIQNLLKSYLPYCIQLQYLTNQTLVQYVCQKLKDDKTELLQKVEEVKRSKHHSEKFLLGSVDIPKMYPLEYALSIKKQILNEYLIAKTLPLLQKLLIPSIDDNLGNSIYLLINLVFFTLVQQDDFIEDEQTISKYLSQSIHTFHSASLDDQRLFIGYQIKNIFSQYSKYKINWDYHKQDKVDNLVDYYPNITHMSDLLTDSWTKLITLSQNDIIQDCLPFYLKYHSSFVQLNQCKYLFAAIILNYYQNHQNFMVELIGQIKMEKEQDNEKQQQLEEDEEEEEEEQQEDDKEKDTFMSRLVLVLNLQQKEENKITTLPTALQEPTPQSFFAVFLICNALQPQHLTDNIIFYQLLMFGYFKINYEMNKGKMSSQNYPNVQQNITGVIKNGQFTLQVDRQRVLNKLQQDFQYIFKQFSSQIDQHISISTQAPHLSVMLVSEIMFILSELLFTSSSEISKYIVKVKALQQKEDYDYAKHYQQLATLGQPPDNVFVIYYDESFDILQVINFIYDNLDLQIYNNIPLKYQNFPTFEEMTNEIILTIITPNYDGIQIIEHLQDIYIQKKTVSHFVMLLPLFVFIPMSEKILDIRLTQKFIHKFNIFTELVNPNYAFLHYPTQLYQQFKFSVLVGMMSQYTYLKSNKPIIPVKFQQTLNIQYIRQFTALLVLSNISSLKILTQELQYSQYKYCYGENRVLKPSYQRSKYDADIYYYITSQFQSQTSIFSLFELLINLIFTDRNVVINTGERYGNIDEDSINMEESSDQEDFIQNQKELSFQEQSEKEIKIDMNKYAYDADNEQGLDEMDLDVEFAQDSSISYEEEEELDEEEVDKVQFNPNIAQLNVAGITQEQTVYFNILRQIIVYESSFDFGQLIDLDKVEENIIDLTFCKVRKIKNKCMVNFTTKILKQIQKQCGGYSLDNNQVQREEFLSFYGSLVQIISDYKQVYNQQKTKQCKSYRSLISSINVQKIIYKDLFEIQAEDQLQPLFNLYVVSLKKTYSRQSYFTKQYSPKTLFAELVSTQLNIDMNTIIGNRQFGIFGHQWIINASSFQFILTDIFNFIKFRNSIVSGTGFNQQKLVFLLEEQPALPTINNEGVLTFQEAQPEALKPFCILFREMEMLGMIYDKNMKSLADANFESGVGFRDLHDIFIYTIVSEKQSYSAPENYLPIPIKINDQIVGYVLAQDKIGITECQFSVRNPIFTIAK